MVNAIKIYFFIRKQLTIPNWEIEMTPIEIIQIWIENNPYLAFGAVVLLSIVVFFIVRLILGRGLTYLASRTETKYDDIFVKHGLALLEDR